MNEGIQVWEEEVTMVKSIEQKQNRTERKKRRQKTKTDENMDVPNSEVQSSRRKSQLR